MLRSSALRLQADLVKLEFDVQGLRYECDEVYAALGAARGGEARTAPAVTKADIENAVRGQWGGCFDGLTDAVWSLVSGADPAVHVVRESELPNLHPRYVRNFNLAKGQTKFRDATRDEVAQAVDDVARDLRYVIAAHRAIEAEDAADHAVEAKAQELVEIVCGDGPTTDDVWDACRRIARHQLGQEASSDE